MSKLRSAGVHISFPGQVVEVLPRIDTLRDNAGLAKIVDASYATFQEAVGKELAETVMQADNTQLKEDTLLGQLRSHYTATVMWLAFLNYSSGPHDTPVGVLAQDGLVKLQLSGDSAGFDTAAHVPAPGLLDDQMEKLHKGLMNKMKRASLMLDTPHDYAIGGMAAIKLHGWKVNRIIKAVNDRLKQPNMMQLVKDNAPRLKIVAGPRQGLDMLAQYAASNKAMFIDNLSPYWFHHSLAMELAGKRYGLYLAQPGVFTQPSPLFSHVSYVTGKVVQPHKLVQDLADGVWKRVHYYTFRGPSVHGAMHKNGYLDAIAMNREIVSWLRDSPKVSTHLMNDFGSLVATKTWLTQVMQGEVQPGKHLVSLPASPSLQPSRNPLYQA